jgi:hypothetical protein
MAKKRRTRTSTDYLNDDMPDILWFLSCPFFTEAAKQDMYQELQEMIHGPQPDPPEPMPTTPDGGDVFRAHAMGIRLDEEWPRT